MLRVAVVAGGYSDESVISLKSGELIYASINAQTYKKVRVRILKEGWYAEIDGEKYPIQKEDFSYIVQGVKQTFDVVFNTIHGTPGEDGYLQAYFELIGIPYTGCPFYQSALTFNKKDCIAVLSKYGIPHAKSVYVHQGDNYNAQAIVEQVSLPCFVKPNRSGSSLGITKVSKLTDFDGAMQHAFKEDHEVLIESFLDGVEVSVGVFKYRGETMVVGITEIVSDNEFFDYAAKYEGESQEITPARISDIAEKRVREVAIKAYESLNMTGFSRSEYILVKDEPHFIEMNTLPGFSPASIFPQQAAYANIELTDIMDSEINLALNRDSAWKE